MKSINEFKNESIDASELYQIKGGRYKKTGCGSRDIGGGCTMSWRCDVKDDEGIKQTHYFGTEIVC